MTSNPEPIQQVIERLQQRMENWREQELEDGETLDELWMPVHCVAVEYLLAALAEVETFRSAARTMAQQIESRSLNETVPEEAENER